MLFLIFWSGSFAVPIGLGSYAVQFGDHLRSRILYGPGLICEPVQAPKATLKVRSVSPIRFGLYVF